MIGISNTNAFRGLGAALFGSQYSSAILTSWLMSRPARHLAFLMFSCGPVRSRLYAKERKRLLSWGRIPSSVVYPFAPVAVSMLSVRP